MDKKIRRALLKTDILFNQQEIDYMVTGTAALDLLGFTPDNYRPGDLDMMVFNLQPRQEGQFIQWQLLSGAVPENNYPQTSTKNFAFLCDGVKVNVLAPDLGPELTRYRRQEESVQLTLVSEDDPGRVQVVSVQKVEHALRDKMALGRSKDMYWLLRMINKLTREGL